MHPIISRTFDELAGESIPYCILRDGDHLEQYANGGEIDLLVPRVHFKRLQGLLTRLGFLRIAAWGHTPHTFFIIYDKNSDSWIKLDIVTKVAYGHPAHALQTNLGDNCIRNRRQSGEVYIPLPEDELVTLLLHCLLDKEYVAPQRGARLQLLCRQIEDKSYISQLLDQYGSPDMNWSDLSTLIKNGEWTKLLAQREAIANHLAGLEPLGTSWRRIRDRLLRKLQCGAGYLRPRAPSIALLAPDGAGKSTLANGIQESFHFPVRLLYMGLYQKQERSDQKKIKGLGLAHKLVQQWQRYLFSRHYRACGKLVIFDRYSYDALLPSPRPPKLKSRIHRWLLAHCCPPPDLILFLDAPGEMLYARKGEHNPAALEKQRQGYLRLRSKLPQMVVVDATLGAESVRKEVTGLIWQQYIQQFG